MADHDVCKEAYLDANEGKAVPLQKPAWQSQRHCYARQSWSWRGLRWRRSRQQRRRRRRKRKPQRRAARMSCSGHSPRPARSGT